MVTDQPSFQDQGIPTNWSLLPLVVDEIGRPMVLVDLFYTKRNHRFLIYISPVPDPMAWKEGAFQHLSDHIDVFLYLSHLH